MKQFIFDLLAGYDRRRRRSVISRSAPSFGNSMFLGVNDYWYDTSILSRECLERLLLSPENIFETKELLSILPDDPYLRFLKLFYEQSLKKLGSKWVYADILTVLNGITKQFPINSYLEIGVRNGRSMSVVGSNRPDCEMIGVDLWLPDYAGMDNPGPDFVREQLKRVGHAAPLKLITGDSKIVLKELAANHPNHYFDLITVDGDHSVAGASADIRNSIQLLKTGGFLVFDDISSPHHPYLSDVWRRECVDNKRLITFEFRSVGLGVGVAVKIF